MSDETTDKTNTLSLFSSKLRRYFYPIFFSLLVIGIMFVIYNVFFKPGSTSVKTKAASADVVLELTPSNELVNPGQAFDINVFMNTQTNTVTAADINIVYDATKLEGQSITAGTYLPEVLKPGTIGNGTASIILGCNPTTPQKGTGIIATLHFIALPNISNTTIAFSSTTQVAAIGQTINVIGTMTSSTIDKVVAPSPTPFPTATKIPSQPTLTPFPTATKIPAQPTATSIPPPPTATKIPPTPTPTYIPGDLNHDGVVDIKDYNQLISDFGKTGTPGWITSDINKTGKVDISDYNILVQNFGKHI